MRAIYTPDGAAWEYSPLALNIYKGCAHGCRYCFARTIGRSCSMEEWTKDEPDIKKDLFPSLEKDCKELAGCRVPVLLCFTSDPYQPTEAIARVTRKVLETFQEHDMSAVILTKGDALAQRDFDILTKMRNSQFAVSLTGNDKYEPNAGSTDLRLKNLKAAIESGLVTWTSFEPVLNTDEALRLMEVVHELGTDQIRIGKLNIKKMYDDHLKEMKELEDSVDWPKFREDVRALMARLGRTEGRGFILKKDLLNA